MVTIEEAIQKVQSMYSKGVQSSSSRLSSRHIYSALITARSVIIRQMHNKNQFINNYIYQTLPCVELEEAPLVECECVPEGCKLLRTKYKIPKPIAGLDNLLIKSITSLDGETNFSLEEFEHKKYSGGNKFTSKKSKTFLRNGRLYLTVYTQLKAISLDLLIDDPIEGHRFPSLCDENKCDCISNFDFDFHIDGNSLDGVAKIAYNELIVLFGQMKEDKNSNSTDDNQISGMVHQPQEQGQ